MEREYVVLDGYCFFSGIDMKTRHPAGTILSLTDEQLRGQEWKVAPVEQPKQEQEQKPEPEQKQQGGSEGVADRTEKRPTVSRRKKK